MEKGKKVMRKKEARKRIRIFIRRRKGEEMIKSEIIILGDFLFSIIADTASF
jgi:hypothetical protein